MKKEAILWENIAKRKVRCKLCAHKCVIDAGQYGLCGVRENIDGTLYTHAYGEVIAANIDPIEKKPLYHLLPGTKAFSVATIGCNFTCSFCQNWNISQRSFNKEHIEALHMSPEEIVSSAVKNGCESISYTYTEPTIFFEYALETAISAKENDLRNSFVTNGFMSQEAVDMVGPYLDAANIDLKFFSDESYRKICGGRLDPVLESIRYMREKGIWLEITTLIIPGENDSSEELDEISSFIADIDKNIPWHVSRFHPDYRYTDSYRTPLETIELAVETGKNNGLKYIYPGNILSNTGTLCPECSALLIKRDGFTAEFTDNWENGNCGKCGIKISGIWD